MMKNKRFSILIAIAVLILASMACNAVTGEPVKTYTPVPESSNIANAHMSLDAEDTTSTTIYRYDAETFHCFFDLVNSTEGNVVRGDWILISSPGYQPRQLIDSVELTSQSDGNYYFYLDRTQDSWPTGYYAVEIFYNGTLAATVDFEVK